MTKNLLIKDSSNQTNSIKVPDIETNETKEPYKLLDSILGSSGVAIFVTDLDGTIEKWNKEAQNMYGYFPDEIIGKSFSILISDSTGDISQLLNRIQKQGIHRTP